LKIERHLIRNGQVKIPNIVLEPENSIGGVIIVHGYGGSKEEQLGLAWRITEIGLTSIAVDLRGHGENLMPLTYEICSDLEATIEFGMQFGKVTVIGHSLGGRLALLSNSNNVIAISPALNQEFSETTRKIIESIRSYRVIENSQSNIFDILHELPIWKPDGKKNVLILYGSRDVPEIVQTCHDLSSKGVQVQEIINALHSDTFLLEESFNKIIAQIKLWYS
jgi:esterase/lipase